MFFVCFAATAVEAQIVPDIFWYKVKIVQDGDKAFYTKNTQSNNSYFASGKDLPSAEGAFVQYNRHSHNFVLWVDGIQTSHKVSVTDAYEKSKDAEGWTVYKDRSDCSKVWAKAWVWKFKIAYFESLGCQSFSIPTAG